MLTKNDFQYDGLQTGYPNGEPVWHYVKDLEGITEDTLVSSLVKKGKFLVRRLIALTEYY